MDKNGKKLLNILAREIGHRICLVHHVPGRMRLRFDSSLAEHPQREALRQWVPDDHCFELLDFNLLTKKALVHYDAQIIQPKLIDELFQTRDLQRKESILEQIKELAL